ncbi:hypothetical protein NS226_15050 [Aureimonas ureilytica]|uniref:Uncharacterized protein n=1 Tax=Aureimonas ureilytica TaxID=401562 RepID=A0A175R5M0_9HYPH|nr:hypothetical protein NS226_15050 [Aureimonas ureilytica]
MFLTKRSLATGLCVAALLPLVAGCQGESAASPKVEQWVKVEVVKPQRLDERMTLTGTIAARTENNLSFRTNGRIVERRVDVGDAVRKGEVLARLDPSTQQADVDSARAGVASAQAQVQQATAAFERARSLFSQGFVTRREFDQADQALKVANAGALSARAELASAEDALSFTELKADADGIVTDRKLDVGEIAQAAATVFTIAWDGPRDALFDISEGLLLRDKKPAAITVALIASPSIRTEGAIRQVAPSVDPQTATVRVKIGLDQVPAGMTLGAAVSGSASIPSPPVFVVPPAALTSLDGKPALWMFNPATSEVSMRPVDVSTYETASVVVNGGLQAGEQVVVEGTKLLRPGQKVSLSQEAAAR